MTDGSDILDSLESRLEYNTKKLDGGSVRDQLKTIKEIGKLLNEVQTNNIMTTVKQIKKSGSKALTTKDKGNKPLKEMTLTEFKQFWKVENEKIQEYNEADSVKNITGCFLKMSEETKALIISEKNDFQSFTFMSDQTATQIFKIVYPMRYELIKELDIQSRSEFMLLDSALMNYSRHLNYQHIISRYIESGINTDKTLIIEKFNKMSDSCLNRFIQGIEAIKTMKLIPIRVNIKNSQVNVGNNQQILKAGDVPKLKNNSQIISEAEGKSLLEEHKQK